MEKFIKIKNPTKDCNMLKIKLYYDLGGYNCWHGNYETRGYYISVTPVYKDGYLESYTLFTGVKQCIKAVNRKSEKAYNAALESLNEFLSGLIAHVCAENKIEVCDND